VNQKQRRDYLAGNQSNFRPCISVFGTISCARASVCCGDCHPNPLLWREALLARSFTVHSTKNTGLVAFTFSRPPKIAANIWTGGCRFIMIITLRARLLGLRSLTLRRSLPSLSGEANRAAGSCAFSTPRNLGLDPNIYEMGPTAPIRILASDAAHLQPRPLLERPISPLWLCSGTHTHRFCPRGRIIFVFPCGAHKQHPFDA
jgi:hypothetical protein